MDYNVTGTIWYYRIKQVDLDGRFSYSKVVTITKGSVPETIVLSPNPVNGQATLTINSNKATSIVISIISMNGQVIFTDRRSIIKGTNLLNIELTKIAGGVYILNVTDDSGSNKAIRFIKN